MNLEPGAPEYRTSSFGGTTRVRVTRAGVAFQKEIKDKRGHHKVTASTGSVVRTVAAPVGFVARSVEVAAPPVREPRPVSPIMAEFRRRRSVRLKRERARQKADAVENLVCVDCGPSWEESTCDHL